MGEDVVVGVDLAADEDVAEKDAADEDVVVEEDAADEDVADEDVVADNGGGAILLNNDRSNGKSLLYSVELEVVPNEAPAATANSCARVDPCGTSARSRESRSCAHCWISSNWHQSHGASLPAVSGAVRFVGNPPCKKYARLPVSVFPFDDENGDDLRHFRHPTLANPKMCS